MFVILGFVSVCLCAPGFASSLASTAVTGVTQGAGVGIGFALLPVLSKTFGQTLNATKDGFKRTISVLDSRLNENNSTLEKRQEGISQGIDQIAAGSLNIAGGIKDGAISTSQAIIRTLGLDKAAKRIRKGVDSAEEGVKTVTRKGVSQMKLAVKSVVLLPSVVVLGVRGEKSALSNAGRSLKDTLKTFKSDNSRIFAPSPSI